MADECAVAVASLRNHPLQHPRTLLNICVISGFHREVDEKCALLRVQDSWTLKTAPFSCPETSAKNYHYMLRNIPAKRRAHFESSSKIVWDL